MATLFTYAESSWWPEISAGCFGLFFALMVIWIYLPTRKHHYQTFEKLPLDQD